MNLQTAVTKKTKNVRVRCTCCPHIETSQLICTANQLTGFYMMATLAFNGLTLNERKRIDLPIHLLITHAICCFGHELSKQNMHTCKPSLREKCPNTEFFLVRISRHSDWRRGDPSIYPYSVRMRENTDQKKLRIWTLFTQCIWQKQAESFLTKNFFLKSSHTKPDDWLQK